MKIGYALGATFASAVLGFCIAAAITAQASHSWYRVFKDDVQFTFGLYKVCVNKVGVETCYSFRPEGMKSFAKNELSSNKTTLPIVDKETQVFRNSWILSFFAIVFTGMAFILSVPTAILSYSCNIHNIVPKVQVVFTFVGTVIGVTSIAYAYDKRDAMWPNGVAAIHTKYSAFYSELEFTGRGMLFQTLYAPIEFVAFLVYLVLMCKHNTAKKNL